MRRTTEQMNYLDQDELREAIAAVTSQLFQDQDYGLFFNLHADRVGGVTGIWDICVQSAAALVEHEPDDWDEHEAHTDISYHDAIIRLANLLIDHSDLVRDENFDQLAKWAINGTTHLDEE